MGVVALVIVLVVAVVGYAALGPGGDDSPAAGEPCADGVEIAADPAISEVVVDVLADAGCDGVTVTAAPAQRVLARLGTGVRVPDLWIPDSSLWLDPAEGVAVAVDSLATTPVVLATGRGSPPGSWRRAVRADRFVAGDPLTSTAAAVALYAGAADSEEALVGLAQRAAEPESGSDSVGEVSGTRDVTVLTEQQWLSLAPDLAASVPDRGTVLLDHPLVVTASEERRDAAVEAAEEIEDLLTAPTGAEALAALGFRDPSGEPIEGGVGDVAALSVDGGAATELLQRWSTLAIPTRTLAVFDVSGSMAFAAGDTTRIELTLAAAVRGLALFPRTAEVGLWAFSQADDGALDGDRSELLPVRGLDRRVGDRTHREALVEAIGELPGLTGGGTSLYDTAVAAYEAAVEGYQSDVVNSVLLFTDGANDDPDSLTRQQMLSALQDAVDPERPVRIITIGVSDDADADALRAIAGATGGQSYVARSPEDIGKVFQRAISARE